MKRKNRKRKRPDDINEEIRKLMKLSKEDQFSSKENKFGFQTRFLLAEILAL